MKALKTVYQLESVRTGDDAKDVVFREVVNDDVRRIVEVWIRAGAVLAKHRAAEAITVLCLAGSGTFTAGSDLDSGTPIGVGTLITLDAEVDHAVSADTELHIMVTKFK